MKDNFIFVVMGILLGIVVFMSIGFIDLYNRVEDLESRISEQTRITSEQSKDIWWINSELDNLDLYWEIEEVK